MRNRVAGRKLRALVHLALLALLAPFLVLAAATPAQAEPSADSTITGTVTGVGGTRKYALTVALAAVGPDGWVQRGVAFPLADGSYFFSGLPAGTYTLYFTGTAGTEFESEWWDDALTRADAQLIVLDGTNSVVADAVIGLRGAVQGRTTGLGGREVLNFGVTVYRVEGSEEHQVSASLDWPSGGGYRIDDLLPGNYRIIYAAEGYRDKEISVAIGVDETITRDIQLEPRPSGDLGSVTTTPVALPYLLPQSSTVELSLLPKVFSDVRSVDPSACQAGTYAWTAELAVSPPWGPGGSSAAFDGGGQDPGAAPRISRQHEVVFSSPPAVLGTHAARVEITSSVSYGSCSDAGVEQRTHTWHETLLTGLEVTGELFAFDQQVVGTPARGQTLTVTGGFYPEPDSTTYRWLRDGVGIPGATAQSYDLGTADVDAEISVEVVGHKDKYADLAAVSSRTTRVTGDAWTHTPVPAITGTPATGQTLRVVPGTWDAGAALTYQWLRDGIAIPAGTGSTYRLGGADLDTRISVEVTARRLAAARVSKRSAQTVLVVEGTSAAPTPTISGVFGSGQVLTAAAGTLAEGTTFSYQWIRNGSPIRYATGRTYLLGSADPGARISVRVTAHLDGCPPVSATSASSDKVMLISRPRISGELTVGTRLSLVTGKWTAKVSFAYQWLRDGSPIPGATGTSYKLTRVDTGAKLAVRVTARRSGYARVTVASGNSPRVVSSATVRISGPAVVGATLSASPGTWSQGMVPSFQWLRNGRQIPGATASTYTPRTTDDGAQLSVRVTEEQLGWATVIRTSGKTPKVLRPGIPTIVGTPSVGSTVKAVVGSWTSKTGFTYRWLRNGLPIKGATSSRYVVRSDDAGAQLGLSVTGRRKGYATATVTSAGVGVPVP